MADDAWKWQGRGAKGWGPARAHDGGPMPVPPGTRVSIWRKTHWVSLNHPERHDWSNVKAYRIGLEHVQEVTPATLGVPIDTPIDNATSIRQLCHEMWAATHTAGMTTEQVLFRLSLLSGMALSVLLDYARKLEGESDA